MQDSLRYKGMREELINKLRNSGIKDEKILNAVHKVPRHFFLDTTFAEQAYTDMAFQIGAGQTITNMLSPWAEASRGEVRSGLGTLPLSNAIGMNMLFYETSKAFGD